jgi:signal transduction histidine kinase
VNDAVAETDVHLSESSSLGFLSGGGELGHRIREFNWSGTPLGAPQTWPQNLRMALRIMLTSRQPIWIGWGNELTYFYNDAYKSIVGGKHPWALGRPTAEVWREIHSDIGPMLDTAMRGDQGTYVEAQLLIMERNGYPEETYYTFSYSPIPSDDGTVGGIICANSDDTQRVIGERQLALLRALAADTAHARNHEEVCERAAKALGTDPRDVPFGMIYLAEPDGSAMRLAGATGIELGHPAAPRRLSLADRSSGPFADVLQSQTPRLLKQLEASLGGPVPAGPWPRPPAEAALLPILPSGETGRAGVLVVGLNPFRLFDENYRSFLGLVAGQIAGALTSAHAYEEERRRAEALAEIDRAKTTFFSNVSHEFRTPLTLMLGPLEEALNDRSDTSLPALQRNRLETAHRNSLRLLKLVNTLLDFSRIEAGRVQAVYEATDLAAFTAELASNFQSATTRAGLQLEIDCPELPQQVYVDRDMWEKIILNLLSNAFKFTFEGSLQVGTRVSADGRAAEVLVCDTGVGIPESELPRLFERFHRVAGQRSRSFEGSGIGLALVQELVRLHGGWISVESQLGQGTSFVVSIPFGTGHLPAARVGADRDRASTSMRAEAYVEEALRWLPESHVSFADALPQRADGASEAMYAGPTTGAHVLIVDDNADMRGYVQRLLGSRCEVETASNGRAALEMIRQRKPDLVLSDVMMPELDGLGLLRELRSDAELRDVPVILLSARAGEDARVEGLDAGADDYLTKPFSARELIARVSTNLQMAHVRREAMRELRESITERKRAEQILQQANELLEARVQAAIADRAAAEAQLRQAQKMEAIGRLTGGVAHDFNNVLQVIGGNLQLLIRDTSTNALAGQRLQTSLAALDRGARLASQLLAFARRQPLAPKVVNLGRLLRGFDDMLRRALGEGIEVETIIAGGLWNTFVDTAQVENAILNLAINARDAMEGQGKLTIEAGNAALHDAYVAQCPDVTVGQYVMLAVSDTGCGIPDDLLERVFEPFFTTKAEGQGTGLGLSMVYGFVKQSGGHIKIYSEPGQGTVVRVYLPRSRAQEDLEVSVDAGPATGGTETVLVVEDDEAVRVTVVDMLTDLGYRVLKAKDADSALAIIESGVSVDLLFTDVVMPGTLRSPELARRTRERLPNVAVLFTSGYTENAIVHGGRLDDGIDLLSKPYSREALARKVRHVLRNQQQRNMGRAMMLEPMGTAPVTRKAGSSQSNARQTSPPRRLRVLLVEDNEDIRYLAVEMMRSLGHEVMEAGVAKEALTLLDSNRFDVIVADLSLPGMSGIELVTLATKRDPDLGIVIASGYDGLPRELKTGTDARAVFLRKPYDDISLDRALRSALRE